MNIYVVGMCISLVLYVVLGILISSRVKDANDFYVAGRRAPVILIVGSMIASYVSTGMFMGDAGEYYSGLFSPMTIQTTMQVAGYLYGAVYFGRYLRRSQVYTIPEFFGKRFCSDRLHRLASITAIITMVVYLISVIQGIGTLAHVVTGLDYNLCITAALVVFSLVSILSGSTGVLITDTLMFCIFTFALIASAFIITHKAGGWYHVVEQLSTFEVPDLLAWSGNLDYMYSSGFQNVIWGLVYGIVWMSVCMVGPWQSSRYLMARNEHTVIRSSVYSAFGIFALQLLVSMSAVTVNLFHPELESASHVMLWASMNLLPKALGVLLLTGMLAAGISSATTFLSLIGSSFANDLLKGRGNSIRVGQIAMLLTSILILILAVLNPPQIFWIMFFGSSIVASSWMPVAIASVASRRVTRAGAFAGMLTGFLGCFFGNLYTNMNGIVLPPYFNPSIIGIVLNIIAMVTVSALTQVTPEEKAARAKLFIIPEAEKNPRDIRITSIYLKAACFLGVLIGGILLVVWALPVYLTR